jgi:AcrR family transcriptional regulator
MVAAGRRPGPNRTREAIADAARELFATRGYAGTTVRAVAQEAGVNPALVHHYFDTKEGLFLAALDFPFDPAEAIATVLAAGPREQFPERFVRFFVETWRDPVSGQALQAALRRAMNDEATATLVRELAQRLVLERTAAALGVPVERATAGLAQLIGVALAATILRIEPLASLATDELAALVSPGIGRYFSV